MFWLIALAMSAVAVGFVLLPIRFGTTTRNKAEREQINLVLYEERIADIDSLSLDKDEKDRLVLEAKHDLLNDTPEQETRPADSRSTITLALAALSIPVVATLLYVSFGAIQDWRLAEEFKSLDANDRVAYRAFTNRLANRVRARPDNIDAQFVLARAYGNLKEYEMAAVIYSTLLEQFPNDANLASFLAEALFVADKREKTDRVSRAIDHALALNPTDLTTLEINAIAAINSGDKAAGLRWFQRALATGVTGQRAQLIRMAIARIDSPTGHVSTDQVSNQRVINVILRLADGIELAPTLPLFVYARAANGSPAPLAIQRMTVAELPLKIRLDESMSMIPGMSLANFDQVLVIARISSSGDVKLAPGDYEVRSAVIEMDAEVSIELVIESQIQ